tara:strand:- start:17 stop:772 length:756 start_codon:yes stop_codon:yes gene_type:complete
MSLIIPANTLAAAGYEVENSVLMDRSGSDHFKKSPGAGNRRTWTFATWVKRTSVSGNHDLITSGTASAVKSYIYFYSSGGKFSYEEYSGGYQINIKTNTGYQSTSDWYHLIVAVDTTQGTSSNRIKMYVDGVQITSLAASTYPSQNFQTDMSANNLRNIGCEQNSANFIDGYLAETVFIDGLQLDETSFGEFNGSGVFVPIDISGLTFGAKGFYFDYKDENALGNDVSGNNNDYTAVNLTSGNQSTVTPTS